jgi:trypsin-like peptidase
VRRAAAAAPLLPALLAAAAGCGAAAPAAPQPLRVTVAHGLTGDVATGVPVGPGRVLTVAHVLAGAARVRVAGRPARVVRADAAADLAVLAVRGVRALPLRLAGDGSAGRACATAGPARSPPPSAGAPSRRSGRPAAQGASAGRCSSSPPPSLPGTPAPR